MSDNAGAALWRDDESVTCPEQGFTLVTSRNPDDPPALPKTAWKHSQQPDRGAGSDDLRCARETEQDLA